MPKIVETIPRDVARHRSAVLAHPQLRRLLQEVGGAGADVEERLARLFDAYTRPRPLLTGQQERLGELRERTVPWTPPRPLTPDEVAFRSGMSDLLAGLQPGRHLRAIYQPTRRLTEDEEAVRLALSGAAMRSAQLVPPEEWKALADKLNAWFETFLKATRAFPVLEGSHGPHAALLALQEPFRCEFPELRTDRDQKAAVALFGVAVGVVDVTHPRYDGLNQTPIPIRVRAALAALVSKWTPTRRRPRPKEDRG